MLLYNRLYTFGTYTYVSGRQSKKYATDTNKTN